MRKLLFAAFLACGFCQTSHATNPIYGTVQITTTTSTAPTLQTGAIKIASGTIQTLNTSTLTVVQINVSSNAVLSGATFYGQGPITIGNPVTISTNTVLPGATFYGGGALTKISTPTVTGPLTMSLSKILSLANGSSSTDAAAFGQVKVVQVVSSNSATAFSTTSSAFQLSNSTVSITPLSASDNIIVMACGTLLGGDPNVSNAEATLFRGATNLGTGGSNADLAEISTAAGLTGNSTVPCCMLAFDSPATTASTSYTVRIASSDNTHTTSWGPNVKTFIVVLETAP